MGKNDKTNKDGKNRKFSSGDFRRWGQQGGMKGGAKGGKASAAKLTPQQRSDRARAAALARHHKPPSG